MAASASGVAVEDALFQQARDVQGKEFEEWVGGLQSTLQLNDRGSSCLTILRQLYVLTAVTKYSRDLSPQTYALLRSVVLEPEQGPAKIRLLASAILRELTPSLSITVRDFSPPVEESNIPFILPVLLAQSNARNKLSQLAPQVVRWLTQAGYGEELILSSLALLHSLCSHGRALEQLSEDQFRTLGAQFSTWLRHASKNSLATPSSGISLFSSTNRKQLIPVKEIDGSASQDIFTILNIGGYYSSDQLLNIHTFSLLRRWLITAYSSPSAPSPTPTPTQEHKLQGHHSSPVQERRSSSRSSSITPSHMHPFMASLPSPLPQALSSSLTSSLTASLIAPGRTRQGLREAVMQYCLRVIDQCERKPVRSVDEELVTACLYESISTLDILCMLSRSLTHGVLPKMRKLYARFVQDPVSNGRLLLALVKFFIVHGESEMYDSETPINTFFGQVLSAKFNDPGLAYDTVEFLVDNMELLLNTTTIFSKYFPSILKILAWSPITFISEFLQLLPGFISKTAAAEVLHSLFDLPCLAATLQVQHLLSAVPTLADTNAIPQYTKCLTAYQDPAHKLMFGHYLRMETGKGDTIDRLSTLHHLLGDFSGHQRVLAAAEVTPLLLRVFFKTLFYGGEGALVSQLVPLLMERTVLLYSIPSFQSQVRKVIAEQLLEIFRCHTHLVVDHQRDLLEFLGNLRNLSAGGEHCYLHLVWILGEYSHVGYDARCTTSLLVHFFETLESVTYEVAMNHHRQREYTTRLVLGLMSTVAKIASRCQDLIPRALLCLNKIVQLCSESTANASVHRVLLGRANELVNVLKIPSIASAVLSPAPPSGSGRGELERQTNMAYLLQSTATHFSKHSHS